MLKSCAIFLEVVLKLSTMKILTMKLLIKVIMWMARTTWQLQKKGNQRKTT